MHRPKKAPVGWSALSTLHATFGSKAPKARRKAAAAGRLVLVVPTASVGTAALPGAGATWFGPTLAGGEGGGLGA